MLIKIIFLKKPQKMYKFKRQMPQSTKNKISASLTGKRKSEETKEKISQSLKNAWAQVPKTTTSNFLEVERENNEINTNY